MSFKISLYKWMENIFVSKIHWTKHAYIEFNRICVKSLRINLAILRTHTTIWWCFNACVRDELSFSLAISAVEQWNEMKCYVRSYFQLWDKVAVESLYCSHVCIHTHISKWRNTFSTSNEVTCSIVFFFLKKNLLQFGNSFIYSRIHFLCGFILW